MKPFTRRSFVTLSVAALAAAGCAPAGLAMPGTGSKTPTSATTTATPPTTAAPASPPPTPSVSETPSSPATTPSAPETTTSPEPPVNPDVLIPGKNHIGAAAEYVYSAKQVQRWLQGKDAPPKKKKIVFLTFDDGPNHQTTPIILDALKDAGVHATFYVVGSMLNDAPELLQREIAEGHSINLHSWSHDYSHLYPGRSANAKRIEEEYLKTLAKVREILGDDFNTEGWRYPGGHMSWNNMKPADKALAKHGVAWVDWNADTADSAPKSRRPSTIDQLVANATMPIRAGYHVAVVLGHDTPDKSLTAKSTPAMIKAYKKAGYTFGVIS